MDSAGGEIVFLTKQETRTLTGTALRVKQIDVLRENRIPFTLNASGWPVVTRAAVEGRRDAPQAVTREWQPASVAEPR